jgi:hypothetical protein
MATTKNSYAGSTALTCTLNSLSNGSARQSNVLDNSSTSAGTPLALDILLGGQFATASGSLGTNPGLTIYAAGISFTNSTPTDVYGGSYDGTTDVLGGGDAAFTMPSNVGNFRLAAFVPINDAAQAEVMEPVSLAAVFGGTLPPKMVIVVVNNTGLALGSSGNALYTNSVNTTTA